MKQFIVILLFCLCFTTQAMSCGKADENVSFEVSVYKRAEARNCTFFKIIYPKTHGISRVARVYLYTDVGIGARLQIVLKEDHAFSVICMNEEILSKSELSFSLITPFEEEAFEKGVVSFCVPTAIEIDNLSDLLIEGDMKK